jgi:hypothetical protein
MLMEDAEVEEEEEEEQQSSAKSLALVYYEQETARCKRWMTTTADQFTQELENGKRFLSIFKANLPELYEIM